MRARIAMGRWRGRRALRGAAILALSALLPACTVLPDWADPGGWFEEEAEAPTRISAAGDTESAQAGDFPNLASVPDAPRAATPSVERAEIAKGLAADRSNAQYSGQRLVGEGSAQATPPNAPPQPLIAESMAGTAPSPAPVQVPAQAPGQAPTQTAQAPQASQAPVAMAAAPVAPPVPQAQFVAPPQSQFAAPPQAQAPQAPQRPVAGRSELAGIIYFAHGSASLNAEDRAILGDIAALHRQRGGIVRVIGHASARTGTVDPVAHRIANLEISQQRADSVAAALTRMGVPRADLAIEAHADAQPVYHEFMPTGEAGNRRVEIFLEY